MRRNLLVMLALLLGLVTIGNYRARLAAVSDLLSRAAPRADQAALRDQLIGTSVDLGALLGEWERAGRAPMVALWILDLDACRDCLSFAADWDRLGEATTTAVIIGTLGDVNAQDAQRLMALPHAEHVPLSRESVGLSFGWLPSSTKILLDSESSVLMLDGREDVKTCNWSFEGQVGALLGLNSSRMISGAYSQSSSEDSDVPSR